MMDGRLHAGYSKPAGRGSIVLLPHCHTATLRGCSWLMPDDDNDDTLGRGTVAVDCAVTVIVTVTVTVTMTVTVGLVFYTTAHYHALLSLSIRRATNARTSLAVK